jgi:hypothetical protein
LDAGLVAFGSDFGAGLASDFGAGFGAAFAVFEPLPSSERTRSASDSSMVEE